MTLNSRLLAPVIIAAAASAVLARPVGLPDAGTINNPVSFFDIFVDGQFSGPSSPPDPANPGIVKGKVVGEWSDVIPAAFQAGLTPTAPPTPVSITDPRANVLVYGALDPGKDSLYLLYSYTGRTTPFQLGDVVADISFPLTIGGTRFNNANVEIRYQASLDNTVSGVRSLASGVPSFQAFVQENGKGTGPEVPASGLGIEAAVGFGPDILSSTPHLIAELGVPLLIRTLNPKNDSGSGYTSDPAFWGVSAPNNAGDPPLGASVFTINPISGSVSITPTPEPEDAAVVGATGLLGFVAWRRLRYWHRS